MSTLSFDPNVNLNKSQLRKLGVSAAICALRAKGFTVEETRGGLLVNGKFTHLRTRSNSDLNLNKRLFDTWILNDRFIANPESPAVLVDMQDVAQVRIFHVPGDEIARVLSTCWTLQQDWTNTNRTTDTDMRHLVYRLRVGTAAQHLIPGVKHGWLESFAL